MTKEIEEVGKIKKSNHEYHLINKYTASRDFGTVGKR